jgi:hypothetical protein
MGIPFYWTLGQRKDRRTRLSLEVRQNFPVPVATPARPCNDHSINCSDADVGSFRMTEERPQKPGNNLRPIQNPLAIALTSTGCQDGIHLPAMCTYKMDESLLAPHPSIIFRITTYVLYLSTVSFEI